MVDPYQPPIADLRENLPTRAYSHTILAAISNFVAMAVANYVPAVNGVQISEGKVLLEATLTSVATAILFLSVRRLRWYVAILVGPIVGFSLLFGAFVVIGFLGIDY